MQDQDGYEKYKTLAKELIKNSIIFAHTFLVLSWNTMLPQDILMRLKLSDIRLQEDSILITPHKLKKRWHYPKHIYANPLNPEQCPVLSMALYFLMENFSESRNKFWVKDSKWFTDVVMHDCGRNYDDIKDWLAFSITHHAHKYAFEQTEFCSKTDLVTIRSGQTFHDKLEYDEEGDKFIGRVLSGLPISSPLFATPPPRFKENVDHIVLFDAVHRCFPNLVSKHFDLGKFLLASLVYHSDYLKQNLEFQHTLYYKYPFNNEARFLKSPYCDTIFTLPSLDELKSMINVNELGSDVYKFLDNFPIRMRDAFMAEIQLKTNLGQKPTESELSRITCKFERELFDFLHHYQLLAPKSFENAENQTPLQK